MVDFKKLKESKGKPSPINPREIFHALPKPPGINDLYASQADVLDAWYARRTERDLVVKLHTGGGKTLVALLMAQSVMNETGEPVLYLAPTKQLVEQVIAKSIEYGVPTVRYVSGQPLSAEFLDGKAVLVGAYETLFNGRSKFGVRGSGKAPVKVGAIILDDAHVALSSVREAFTLTISAKDHPEVYDEIAARFRFAFKEVGKSGSFRDITSGKDFGVLEVPSWAWHRKTSEMQEYLAGKVDDIDPYVWPYLRDSLPGCHCLFSKNAVAITPILPPVDRAPTFDDCPRRIYMSATIADDSEIVRTFDASPDAVSEPITSNSLAGVGERMILVPALMKLGSAPTLPMVKRLATQMAQANLGVVILSPSSASAKRWVDIATYPEDSVAVGALVTAMQSGASFGPAVLANRYDGIDLAGNACRLLVMDDLPQGTTNYDIFRMDVVADSAVNSLLAQRIEQGIGRGARGGSDYCVVVLVGPKLVGWIGRKRNLDSLTASTRVQLRIGHEVSEAVASESEFTETLLKCIKRDPDWVSYHASELAEAAYAAPIDEVDLRVAGKERRAFRLQAMGNYQAALQELERLIASDDLAEDEERRAWLASLAARIAFQAEDEERGQKFQTSAFAVNNNHTPPKRRATYSARATPGKQSVAIVSRMLQYELRSSLLADFDEALANLVPEASPARYEASLEALGNWLGFEADRPEKKYKKGPDVLWRTDGDFDFVIEAKSEKDDDSPLFKKDHAQLLEAENWFKEAYPHRQAIRVSALPEAIADEKATAKGSFALTLANATKISGALRGVLVELVASSGTESGLQEQCEAAVQKALLNPSGIKSEFLKPFGVA